MDENIIASAEPAEEEYIEKVQISAQLVPVVNYALSHNGFSMLSTVNVKNVSNEPASDVRLDFVCSPEVCQPLSLHVDCVPAGCELALDASSLTPDGEYLASLTEGVKCTLTITAFEKDKKIGEVSSQLSALAFDEWHGSLYYPELVSAFVTPNAPEVISVMKRASELVGEWTDDPSIDSYLSSDPNRVLKMAAAAYEAIRELDITYAVHPASFETAGQRVRLCDAVVADKLGNCIDISLMYAAVLEAMGLNPLLVMTKEHVFAGVWLEDRLFPEAVLDDPSLLSKRMASGVNEIALVECTLARSGSSTGFDDASAAAKKKLSEAELIIDVRRARLSGVKPLPARIHTEQGVRLDTSAQAEEKAAPPPRELVGTVSSDPVEETPATRKASWERKLLDLGLRNTLVSMRMSKTLIPLLTDSLDDLEDALADGEDFVIMPKPQELGAAELGFDNLHEVTGVQSIIRSEFKNHRLRSVFTEAELGKAVKELYRSSKAALEENGANTLYIALGLLKWYENPRSTRARYAPILLLPVEMIRKSANQGYVIRLRDDEVQMNVTILEKLKQDFEITVSGLDPLPLDEHGIDTRKVFTIMRNAVIDQKNWDVFESAYLGVFSFSQFVMWNDIRQRSNELEKNKIVKSLIEGTLQWDAKEMTIGSHVSEDGAMLPLPADASQLFAIQAASSGESFVLHGPPGTGKSQTITAMIANALANGKTVLFVAEKMAALEVVQKRLEKIGLGPFCIEVHSNKTRKKAVLDQLKRASEVTKDTSAEEYSIRSMQIARLRSELDAYSAALHKKQKCGMDVYELINLYEQYKDYPDISAFTPEELSEMTPQSMYEADSAVDELISAANEVGQIKDSPLLRVGQTEYSRSMKDELPEKAKAYREALEKVREPLQSLAQGCGMTIESFEDAAALNTACQSALQWEELPPGWGGARSIYMYLSNVREMCSNYINAEKHKKAITERWNESFLDLDAKALLAEYNEANGKMFLMKGMAVGNVVKKLTPHSKGPVNKDKLASELEEVIRYQDEKNICKNLTDIYAGDLGDFYNGWLTDWEEISRLADKAEGLANELKEISGNDDFRSDFCSNRENFTAAKNFAKVWVEVVRARLALYNLASPVPAESKNLIDDEIALCDNIIEGLPKLHEWTVWNGCRQRCMSLGMSPVVRAYLDGVESDKILGAYKKAVAKGLANRAIDSYNALNHFTGTQFEKKVEQLKELDAQVMELTKQEIFCRLASKIPSFEREAAKNPQLGAVMKLIRNGGRGMSIRKLFEELQSVITRLCPCMLMSPISAAQYLDPHREPFDLVVFDEASQMQTCKAVGALARGKNAVIVGDPKQMPPTSFFSVSATEEEDFETEDLESILDDCLALNMPQTNLLWHYRSRHESLIAFSNRMFYENKLYTFPSVNDREQKVRLVQVDGVFDRGKTRQNRAEAEAVVAELKRRAHDPKDSELSVGIVTFNIMQQNLIDDLLNEECKTDPVLESWAFNGREPLFIKNLENVQGDERDVILFSVGYGPDNEGRITMNFGPLNRDGGWRRLNVAVSRARCEMVVYSTLTADMINLSRTSAEGVTALRAFLEYASGKPMPETAATASRRSEEKSAVADTICRELEDRGFTAVQNVGKSQYKMDIGVVDPEAPDRYLLGILLDGPTYSSSKSTRDREIAQVSVLEGLGWSIMRIWSLDWWDSPKKQIKKLVARLSEEQAAARERRVETEKDDAAKAAAARLAEAELIQKAKAAKSEPAPEEPSAKEEPVVKEEPVKAAPAEEAPVKEEPVKETPVEAPVKEEPVKETPVEAPVEKAPAEETPVEKTPVEETPVEETPVEEAPAEEAPAEEATVEEAPAEESPVEEASDDVFGDIDALKAEVPDYKIAEMDVIWLSEDEFVDKANAMGIKKRLEQIVKTEAPISEELLIYRLLDSCALDEKATAAAEYIKKLVGGMGYLRTSDAGKIFVWDSGSIPGGYMMLRDTGAGETARTPDQVPVEEAVNAVYLLLSRCDSADESALVKACEKLMSFGVDASGLIGTAVAYALRVKNIERSDSGSLALTKNGRRRADALKKAIEKANG